MQATGFPNCCSAIIIYAFGGDETREQLNEIFAKYPEYKAFVAITTNKQPASEKLLKDAGFKAPGYRAKNQKHWHPDTTLKVWVYYAKSS